MSDWTLGELLHNPPDYTDLRDAYLEVCKERDVLMATLVRCIKAVETQEDGFWSVGAEEWDAYAAARKLLGDPVKMHPGGYDGEHFHLFRHDEADGCDTCDDYREEQKQG